MNRRQMVMAGRCRECGAKGHTPHTGECKWIGGVCEYQLLKPPAADDNGDVPSAPNTEQDWRVTAPTPSNGPHKDAGNG